MFIVPVECARKSLKPDRNKIHHPNYTHLKIAVFWAYTNNLKSTKIDVVSNSIKRPLQMVCWEGFLQYQIRRTFILILFCYRKFWLPHNFSGFGISLKTYTNNSKTFQWARKDIRSCRCNEICQQAYISCIHLTKKYNYDKFIGCILVLC